MAEIALRQIRAIIAVCEEGSFTRAAARENSTQSGISQHIAAAERTLGIKLFERSASGVKPTPAGPRYYKRCLEAGAPALEQFVAQYPDVRIHIVEGYSGSLTDMVHGGELDFAVVPASEG